MCDLLEDDFLERAKTIAISKNNQLIALGQDPLELDTLLANVKEAVEQLKPYITDTVPLLHTAMQNKDKILFEGAQGIMLDIDFGTYPYVTSSNTGAGGVASGAGFHLNQSIE